MTCHNIIGYRMKPIQRVLTHGTVSTWKYIDGCEMLQTTSARIILTSKQFTKPLETSEGKFLKCDLIT